MCECKQGSIAPAEITEGDGGVWEGSTVWKRRCLGRRSLWQHLSARQRSAAAALDVGEELMSWEASDISCLDRTPSCQAWATEQSKLSPVIRAGWGPAGTDQGFPGSSSQQPAALHLPCPEAVHKP